jgi:hypothetical protein
LGPGKLLLIDNGPYGESWSEASDYSHALRILLQERMLEKLGFGERQVVDIVR